jgi:hypothetical protein
VATAVLFGAIAISYRSGLQGIARVLLILAPSLIYVSYQNFDNDPLWLVPLAIALFEIARKSGAASAPRTALMLTACIAIVAIGPVMWNMLHSKVRSLRPADTSYVAVFPGPLQQNFKARLNPTIVWTPVALFEAGETATRHVNRMIASIAPVSFQDHVLDKCELRRGYQMLLQEIAVSLEDSGYSTGKSIFYADSTSTLWLFGDSHPVEGGAPWYYGGTEAIRNADYVVVPKCATSLRHRSAALRAIEGDTTLQTIFVKDHPQYLLFSVQKD